MKKSYYIYEKFNQKQYLNHTHANIADNVIKKINRKLNLNQIYAILQPKIRDHGILFMKQRAFLV